MRSATVIPGRLSQVLFCRVPRSTGSAGLRWEDYKLINDRMLYRRIKLAGLESADGVKARRRSQKPGSRKYPVLGANLRTGTGVNAVKNRDNCSYPQLSQLFIFFIGVPGFQELLIVAFQSLKYPSTRYPAVLSKSLQGRTRGSFRRTNHVIQPWFRWRSNPAITSL